MNINTSCATCPSADKPLEEFIQTLDVNTAHHRIKTQDIKCGFGLKGVCCTLCANGPCRITPDSLRGVCGANADTIVARNFLRRVAGGSASYLHIAENAAWNLKETGENEGVIKSEASLNKLADLFGIQETDKYKRAVGVADMILEDLYMPKFKKMKLIDKMGYQPRLERWKPLGLKPGGAKSEVFDAIVKTSTNLNSDPINMLLHALRLGIATGFYGLTLTNLVNDIMLGQPEIRTADVGFNVIDLDYINIMITGHQHSLIADLQDELITTQSKILADAVGAKGFKIIGSTCVGQDLQLRGKHYEEVFAGHSGNNFTTEPLIATGAIDLIVSEFNCTLPGLEMIANEKDIKMVCIDDVAKKSSAEYVEYSYADRKKVSAKIISDALKSYKSRRKHIEINLPEDHGNSTTLTGISEDSLRTFLGGTYEPLIKLIESGSIKGIAAVVGCSNLVSGGHDVFTVELTKQLIDKDILVLSAGCTSGALENVGLMSPEAARHAGTSLRYVCQQLGIPPVLNFGPCLAIGRLELVATELASMLGIDLPDLPLVMSAPQWLEEQAIADGAFALALGLPIHLAKSPFISGSEVVMNTLTKGLPNLTGGQLIIDDNVSSTANKLEEIILGRRKSLGM